MKIKKESKLYKLVDKMSVMFPFGLYMDRSKGVPTSFNDVCTFVRHLLITLFIVFPVSAILILVVGYILFFAFVYTPYKALIGDNESGYFIICSSAIIFLSYILLVIIQHIYKDKKINFSIKNNTDKNGVISQIINVVKEKNSKICKKIDIE